MHEMSFLLPHFLKEGRGQARRLLHARLQPGVDQPRRLPLDRGAHRRVDGRPARRADADLERDRLLRRLRAADGASAPSATTSTPTRRTTASGSASASRCCAPRASAHGEPVADTREVNPGEVWEENEFWIELTWRIDPDGALGIRRFVESKAKPGDEADGRRVLRLDLRALGAGAAREGRRRGAHAARVHAPLRRVRGGAATSGRCTSSEVAADELVDVVEDRFGRVYTRAPGRAPHRTSCPSPRPSGDDERPARGRRAGRRPRAARLPDAARPARVLLAHARRLGLARGARCRPTSAATSTRAGSSADQMPLISTFRLPVHIHTRSANAKWLDEIAHTNPLWLHPRDAGAARRSHRRPRARRDRDRPLRGQGLGHRGDPPRRRRLQPSHGALEARPSDATGAGSGRSRWRTGRQRQMMATVALERSGERWTLRRERGRRARSQSADPDTARHLVDRRRRAPEPHLPGPPRPGVGHALLAPGGARAAAEPGDRHGDIAVDTDQSTAGVRGLARQEPPGRPSFAGRHPTPAVVDPPAASRRLRRTSCREGRRGRSRGDLAHDRALLQPRPSQLPAVRHPVAADAAVAVAAADAGCLDRAAPLEPAVGKPGLTEERARHRHEVDAIVGAEDALQELDVLVAAARG